MSSGGRVQLVAQGGQDIFLTTNPQMSYFLKQYKRHSKFALQEIEIPFDRVPEFGNRARAQIPRYGDMLNELYLKFELPELNQGIFKTFNPITQKQENVNTFPTYCDSVGHALIQQASIKIGQQTIQRINGEYLDIYEDMFTPESQSLAIENLVGRTYERTGLGPASNVAYRTENGFAAVGAFPRTFIVPLRFWMTQDPSLSIPLVALDRQEVEIEIDFQRVERLIVNTQKEADEENLLPFLNILQLGNTPVKLTNASIIARYAFLSEEETNFFKSKSLDYLITQIQGIESFAKKEENFLENPKNIKTFFKNPVKELYILAQSDTYRPRDYKDTDTTTADFFRYSSPNLSKLDNLANLELTFNGQPRLLKSVADSNYLRVIQPLQYHTKNPQRYIYNYSFALDPENYQPTGQANFSRIKDVYFNCYLNDANNTDRTIRIYVKNYNVLRIESGLAGLLFNYDG